MEVSPILSQKTIYCSRSNKFGRGGSWVRAVEGPCCLPQHWECVTTCPAVGSQTLDGVCCVQPCAIASEGLSKPPNGLDVGDSQTVSCGDACTGLASSVCEFSVSQSRISGIVLKP